jgi:hypothetical protein
LATGTGTDRSGSQCGWDHPVRLPLCLTTSESFRTAAKECGAAGPVEGTQFGNFQRVKMLAIMNFETREKRPPSKEEREAKKEMARQAAEEVLAARKKEDDAFRANFERLRAERLARENTS